MKRASGFPVARKREETRREGAGRSRGQGAPRAGDRRVWGEVGLRQAVSPAERSGAPRRAPGPAVGAQARPPLGPLWSPPTPGHPCPLGTTAEAGGPPEPGREGRDPGPGRGDESLRQECGPGPRAGPRRRTPDGAAVETAEGRWRRRLGPTAGGARKVEGGRGPEVAEPRQGRDGRLGDGGGGPSGGPRTRRLRRRRRRR